MVIGAREGNAGVLKLGHEHIKRTHQYKYLGVTISSADRSLKMPATRKAMLGRAWGAHASVMRLKVAAPDMPPGILGTIWQTWVLPQLMYGIGVGIIIIIIMHFRPCSHARMQLKGFFNNHKLHFR